MDRVLRNNPYTTEHHRHEPLLFDNSRQDDAVISHRKNSDQNDKMERENTSDGQKVLSSLQKLP